MQSFERVAKVMERPFYMNPTKAVEFGVADKVWKTSFSFRHFSIFNILLFSFDLEVIPRGVTLVVDVELFHTVSRIQLYSVWLAVRHHGFSH